MAAFQCSDWGILKRALQISGATAIYAEKTQAARCSRATVQGACVELTQLLTVLLKHGSMQANSRHLS